jgi:hypothetical protein
VASLERRIQQLEEVYQLSSGSDDPVEREKRRAAFVETFERAWEKAEREEALGKPRRRELLEELIESMRRRRGA